KHKPRRKEKKKRKETKVSPIELHTKEHVPTTSNDPLPSGEDSMPLKELMVLCTNLSNKVLDLENKVMEMKSSHTAKIAELESRVEKLEEENMSLTKELKSLNSKEQKLEEQQEAEELKRNLEIVPNGEDDVFVNVAPLCSKPPIIGDYKIYKEGKKEEDLEVLWKIVKDRFKESQPKEVLDVFLWHPLKVMFEHSVEGSRWKLQKGPKGLSGVKN
nr:hypothetical protein [Tanacetum cinerariifolium]